MKIFILVCSLALSLSAYNATAQEVNEGQFVAPKIVPLAAQEDDLYTGSEVLPLQKELSTAESAQENSSDVEVIDDNIMQELECGDERLKKQVERFIYKNINKEETNSAIEKRKRLLLVRNMADFTQIDDEDDKLKQNFSAAATIAYLKINQHRRIYKICQSRHNDGEKSFEDIYVVIYPFAGYYKIVVTNLLSIPEKADDATFIFNW